MNIFKSCFGLLEYTIFTNRDDYHKYCNDNDMPIDEVGDNANARAVHYVNGTSNFACVLMFEHHHDKNELMALLVHECVHLYQFFCEALNDKDNGDEVPAYQIQEIFINLLTEYEEQVNEAKTQS